VHPRHRYALDDLLERDWHWNASRRRPITINYGHSAELAWLGCRTVDLLGDPRERIREQVLGLIDHGLEFGFDQRRGGVALRGPPLGEARFAWYLPAAWRVKHWWEQAEVLIGILVAYQWSGQPRYWAAFERQFDWVWTHQLDHECGDWFESTAWRDGRPLTSLKGHEWKASYHGARAFMEVSRRLSQLLGEPQT
jgi:mannobiose 2-epimerase